ncbi:histidinol-phosphate transaminase [Parvularcula sp. LCG005]|uniref:histidinol-phosphate transaminase n=1 Tax=Parvularcula sp. LCG005 TaxID=3078805 RepID=UPI00294229AB|nr:histidinol-phosphate transaminase [Parvularcula sp. LCG005]WOI52868.1 histidinol-phosphate transaminase [Parvularcula sp. LCG005]
MTTPTPKPGLLEIKPYTPGKATTTAHRIIKLSSNESALGASPKATAAYADAAAKIARYPDGTSADLRVAIGEIHDLDPARLIVGAGSDDIINLVIRAYAAEGDHILQTDYGFSYYALAAQAACVDTKFVPETNFTADVDAILDAVEERTRIVFLANPNNPTGTMLGRDELVRLRAGLRDDIILILDGAYAEYVEDDDYTDGRDLVDQSIDKGTDNVIMMRTFSKIYGLGGLRVGWAYAPDRLIDILHRLRSPFNVNGPALKAAEAAIRDQAFVARNRAHNREERARVAGSLSQLGFDVINGYGNFLLFGPRAGHGDDAQQLLSFMEAEGILIRSTASSHLPDHLRVSIGSTDENSAFLEALHRYAEQA